MREFDDAALELRLRGVLKEHLGALPLDLTVDALDRRREAKGRARRSGRGRGITLLAAAALLLVGGALAAGSGILRLPSVVPPAPAPSFAVLVTASPQATPTPTPTPLSLDVTWTQLPIGEQFAPWNGPSFSPRLAWIGDRFVLADVESGAVMTSTDGQDWQAVQAHEAAQSDVDLLRGSFASWQDSAVGWWNPQEHEGGDIAGEPPITARDNVQVVLPPAAPSSTTPFKGRIESIGIGPRGMVAQVHSDLDWDDWVRRKLGARTNNEWVRHVKSVDFENGVLRIKMDNGPGLKVVWADEGLEPGDYQDRGFGWFSPDGEHWTEMAPKESEQSALPTGAFGQVVGVSDGFIATGAYPDGACADPNGSCTGMWYSPDGLTWRLLKTVNDVRVAPWNGGVLAIDGAGRIDFWTSGGPTELQVAAQPDGTVAAGPLGIMSIGDGKVVVSRDGNDSKISSIPAQMADPANGGGGSTVIAVGDRTVVVLERARVGEFEWTNSLWLGTFGP